MFLYCIQFICIESQCKTFEIRFGFCKQRNQFGFFDSSSEAIRSSNPTVQVGCITRAWNTNKANAEKNRCEFGDQFVDLGRMNTTFIGNEENDPLLKNGTFAVMSQFVHDMKKWNELTIDSQNVVFGRTKEDSGIFIFVCISVDLCFLISFDFRYDEQTQC